MTATLTIDFLLTGHIDRNRRLGLNEVWRKFESDRAKSEEVIAKKRGLTGSEIHSRGVDTSVTSGSILCCVGSGCSSYVGITPAPLGYTRHPRAATDWAGAGAGTGGIFHPAVSRINGR